DLPRDIDQRRLLDDDRLQLFIHLFERCLREPRTDVARVNQLLVLVVSQHQGAEVFTLAQEETADDKVLLVGDLDLDPLRAAAGFVPAARVFGYDPFHSLFPDRLKQLVSLARKVIRIANDLARQYDRLQQQAAVDQGGLAQIVAIEVEKVERKKVQRVRLAALDRLVEAGPVLQKLEAGNAVFVQGYDLAIEDCGLSANARRQSLSHFRKLLVHDVAAARNHAHLAILDKAERSVAIPFHLVEP